jgi:hypothetical protein
MTFDEDDDDGEWVMGNDDDDAVQCKVVGDTTTMPEFVRTLVLKAQAELRELRGEGATGAGGSSRCCIKPKQKSCTIKYVSCNDTSSDDQQST